MGMLTPTQGALRECREVMELSLGITPFESNFSFKVTESLSTTTLEQALVKSRLPSLKQYLKMQRKALAQAACIWPK